MRLRSKTKASTWRVFFPGGRVGHPGSQCGLGWGLGGSEAVHGSCRPHTVEYYAPKSSTPPARPLPGRVPLQKTVFQLISTLFLGGRGVCPGSQPGSQGVSGGPDAGCGSYPSTVRQVYATRCAAPRARPPHRRAQCICCCSTVVHMFTCPAITVGTVILRALDRVRERALGCFARSPKSPPARRHVMSPTCHRVP